MGAQIIINGETLKMNALAVKNYTKKPLCAIVKADAYGHNIEKTAKILDGIANYFGVAREQEALNLRAAKIVKPILLIGRAKDQYLPELLHNNITLSIIEKDDIKRFLKYDMPAKVHIKIDSGMHRLGISDKKTLTEIFDYSQTNKNLKIEGVYTHFGTADSDADYLRHQLKNFTKLTAFIKERKNEIMRHAANSAAIMHGKEYYFDMVRPGLMLYGYGHNENIALSKSMSVFADIVQIKELKKGDYLGYDNSYCCPKNMTIAIISIGYGDGYPRLINKGYVMINNTPCNILGKVCMDLLTVDISHIKGTVSINDKAVIMDKKIDANTIASWSNTISYDILTGWTNRTEKKWV